MSQKKIYSFATFVLALMVYVYWHSLSNISVKENYKTVRQTASVISSTVDVLPVSKRHFDTYDVVRVVDGDTIVVNINGVDEKVRLIGVDTPETVDHRKKVQCFGKEASSKTKELLSGGQVRLASDSSQGDKDKYGRLLRYAFLPDGTFVNKVLISEGFAHEYTYRIPYKYQNEFKQAQNTARESKLGMWADGVCQ